MAQSNLTEQWENDKRPALKQLFQKDIYGFRPESLMVTGELTKEVFISELNATLEEHNVSLSYQEQTLRNIHLMILKPQRPGNHALLFINKCGNHTLYNHKDITIYKDKYLLCKDNENERGWRDKYWNVPAAMADGLTLITFQESEIAPDHKEYFKENLSGFPLELLNIEAPPGLLSFWSWGLSQIMDYLETIELPEQIGLFGHSRRGKTALLTAALDSRFKFVIPHQSGTFGAALTKDKPWESMQRIRSSFPHWFTPKLQDTQNVKELSVEQDDLIALIAPRPVLITEGIFDFWSSPHLSLKALNKSLLIYRNYYPNLPDKLSSFTYWKSDQTKLTLAVAHAQLYHWHTMHGDYWKVISHFLKHKL